MYGVPLFMLLGGCQFAMKLATARLPPLAVTSVCYTSYGLTLLATLVAHRVRAHVLDEVRRNWYWPPVSETFMLCANATLAAAMAALAAPIASAIAASSPLFVLVLEHSFCLAEETGLRYCVTYRMLPVALTVAGVVVLSVAGTVPL
eukprot:TRINITY_DN7747_c2_g2_i4.p1 TRINITY_DN7747_c2_g2~~TRINITY_DN7747_c2_g2_i4.p1  ORF type:complete len:147 (-),score=43.59 TRINITY_DN7747_c2_g2_i4:22-462(-)